MNALDTLTIISHPRESTAAGYLEPDVPTPAADPDLYEVAGRLVSGQNVSIGELNAARAALGRRPFDVPCRCPCDNRPGLCRCGLTLWRDGEAAYLEELRLDALDAMAHAEAEDARRREAEHDACMRDLECWRT